MSEVTRILSAIDAGDLHAAEQLLPLVYEELRKLAARRLALEKPGQTLEATALVHEAYIRLVGAKNAQQKHAQQKHAQQWDSRGHFFAAAAEAMRRILVENARRKKTTRRGGQHQRVQFDETIAFNATSHENLLALDSALEKLAREDPKKAELVKLRCFAGLTHQEAADVLGISRPTADRYWAYAKSRLYCEIYESETDEGA